MLICYLRTYSCADFTRVTMNDSDLTKACLFGTNLAGADLRGVNFTDADLTGANLAGSDLQGAVLSDSNLKGASLERANLTHARLANAVLIDVNLIGAIFAESEPWTAVLYPSNNAPQFQFTEEHEPVTSIEALMRGVRLLRDLHKEFVFYFRGEADCGWELMPSVLRDGYGNSEGEMLVDLMSRRPEEFSDRTTALSQWVLAQHHGLKTRFLDVTKNPLVALFHACEPPRHDKPDKVDGRMHVFAVPREMVKPFTSDTISVIANLAKLSRCKQELLLGRITDSRSNIKVGVHEYAEARRQLYQMIRQEKPSFDERIDQRDFYRVFVIEPQLSSERIRAQSGAFLVSACHERFETGEIRKWNPDISCLRPLFDDGSCR